MGTSWTMWGREVSLASPVGLVKRRRAHVDKSSFLEPSVKLMFWKNSNGNRWGQTAGCFWWGESWRIYNEHPDEELCQESRILADEWTDDGDVARFTLKMYVVYRKESWEDSVCITVSEFIIELGRTWIAAWHWSCKLCSRILYAWKQIICRHDGSLWSERLI